MIDVARTRLTYHMSSLALDNVGNKALLLYAEALGSCIVVLSEGHLLQRALFFSQPLW